MAMINLDPLAAFENLDKRALSMNVFTGAGLSVKDGVAGLSDDVFRDITLHHQQSGVDHGNAAIPADDHGRVGNAVDQILIIICFRTHDPPANSKTSHQWHDNEL
jgi:hypothetical protein